MSAVMSNSPVGTTSDANVCVEYVPFLTRSAGGDVQPRLIFYKTTRALEADAEVLCVYHNADERRNWSVGE